MTSPMPTIVAEVPPQPPRASVVIPSYNGRALLERYLGSVVQAVKMTAGDHEILVVDDGGSDDTAEFLGSSFPAVRLVRLDTNSGFQRACNLGAAAGRGDVVVFLNNDMRVELDFLSPLLAHFADKSVFAVCARSLTDRGFGVANESPTCAWWERGEFRLAYPAYDSPSSTDDDRPGPVAYAFGGALAVNKQRFLELAGFDDLYAPWTVEDVDLSYRAWKRGWRVLYEPHSLVHHEQGATIGSFRMRYRRQILAQNFYLFTWKNITSRRLLFSHVLWLPIHQIGHLCRIRRAYALGLLRAIRRLPRALARRRHERTQQRLSDEEVLAHVSCSRWAHPTAAAIDGRS